MDKATKNLIVANKIFYELGVDCEKIEDENVLFR